MKRLLSKLLIAVMVFAILPVSSAFASSQQEQIAAIAKDNLGVPYKYGGTAPSGFDCSGFLFYVFGKVGITLPRVSADQYNAGTPVSKSDLAVGDLVFFEKTYDKAGITHSGIYIGDNQFISATTSSGIKIDSLSSTYWGPKFAGAKRVVAAATASASQQYTDLSADHPAYAAVNALSSQNIIKGFENSTFLPENPVTRGQAAAIINRVLKKDASNLNGFKDVSPNYQFANDIAAIRESGIITGFADGTFRPNSNMTRAEMAVIIQRAFNLKNKGVTAASTVYSDVSPGYWAFNAIMVMHQIDTTSIFGGSQYRSSSNATRAVFSAAIYNSMNNSR
ncbi:C40 family peptidase [Bacillus infantis]|uniref:Hydrolase Nlp/P60 n=1 Tax=Bacillus infantis TaxID=324767 RepID=A0A5D4R6K5_9BACI|nr:C40 family peptidase [Bacillus infantis]TYS47025.1 hypothetical protein FZD51_16325 [Bacillus infantis]